jgi:tetratricopeptide repeat protein 30
VFELNKQKAAQILRETAIVEAINLKAAILFIKEEYAAAKMTIKRVPAINAGGIDPVTFHNQAIFFVTENSADSIKKMNHLLRDCLFPPETFQNLLFLYCKYFFYDLANELIVENPKFCQKLIEKDDLDYISTLILQQTDAKQAFVKYHDLLKEYRISITNLKSKYKELPETSKERRTISIRIANLTDKYVAVLTNQAKIAWDQKDYRNVELLFKESADICKENKVFQVNLAHSIYMQERNYTEAINYYEPIVSKHKENLLKCETIVLANLCVCYILTKQNEKAENLIKSIEEHEKIAKINDPSQQVFHCCIVNLVIGTLYCAKNMYPFGVKLLIKSLDPIKEKLGTDTWYYTKR